MNPDHIDFMSAYCDRWCERCALSHRCSVFTAMTAIAMCEDETEGLELALGRAPEGGPAAPSPRWHEDVAAEVHMSPGETAEWLRDHEARRERIEATPMMQLARAFMLRAHRWLLAHEPWASAVDDVVREALEVARHDVMFIRVKLHRALDGQDRRTTDGDPWDGDAIQNDWNGSAKVALIAIERSTQAWSVLASCSGDETPAILAAQLAELRAQVEQRFPDAWRFRRPGFDAR